VSEAVEDAANDVTGINNEYGEETEFANSCGLIFQREAAGCVEAIAPQVQVTSGDVLLLWNCLLAPLPSLLHSDPFLYGSLFGGSFFLILY
jgi:hypothetical protein